MNKNEYVFGGDRTIKTIKDYEGTCNFCQKPVRWTGYHSVLVLGYIDKERTMLRIVPLVYLSCPHCDGMVVDMTVTLREVVSLEPK